MACLRTPERAAALDRVSFATLVSVLVTGACSGAAAPTQPSLPETVVLRVDRVEVAATKPGTLDRWDGPAVEPSPFPCRLLGLGVGAVSVPVVGKGAEALCDASRATPQAERNPADPDLELRVSARNGAAYVSRTTPNVLSETFKYEVAIATGAIPDDGLLIEVLDEDAGAGPETVGAIRVSREDLMGALASPTRLVARSNGAIRRLELVVSEYSPLELVSTSMAARDGFHSVRTRALFAGEVVEVSASGTYTVGRWYDKPIGPRGYPADAARGYNLETEPFHSAPHACGVVTVGAMDTLQGALVTPIQKFVTRVPGPLRFGINDNEPANNHGQLAFNAVIRAPSPEEWLTQDVRR
jgi:hypothetical protein